MGWSCRKEAGEAMDAMGYACRVSTGSSNVWNEGATFFMFEPSRKEHDDGAVTGSVLRFLGNPLGAESCSAVRAGTFRIEGDGTVSRGSKFLKNAAKEFAGQAPWTWKAAV